MDVNKVEFGEFSEEKKGAGIEQKILGDIPIQITVELGRTQMTLREILELQEGTIVEIGRLAGEPLDLKVGSQLIAQGEVVAVDDKYGLRITHMVMR